MAILLALIAAVAYGLSDFVGGVASRRVTAWQVAFLGSLSGGLIGLAVSPFFDGSPTGADFAWSVLAGVGNGIGTTFLYRGLASGRMGVVAPVSGIGAALLPVLAGVGFGERPSALAWIGVAVAFPAIWLVAQEAADPEPRTGGGSGVIDGLLAGAGFGTLFVALERFGDDAGLVPLATNQLLAALVIAAAAAVSGQAWLPRERAAAWGAVCGVLAFTATLLFLFSTHYGFLSVTAVITSLYPAFTVLLAAVALKERIHRTQLIGLMLSGAAVILVAVG